MEFAGTLRIRNPKTLKRWIRSGKHQKQLDRGFIFNVGCGRYRTEKCECGKCRKSKNSPLKHILEAQDIHED